MFTVFAVGTSSLGLKGEKTLIIGALPWWPQQLAFLVVSTPHGGHDRERDLVCCCDRGLGHGPGPGPGCGCGHGHTVHGPGHSTCWPLRVMWRVWTLVSGGASSEANDAGRRQPGPVQCVQASGAEKLMTRGSTTGAAALILKC